jgi:hypothetical protein
MEGLSPLVSRGTYALYTDKYSKRSPAAKRHRPVIALTVARMP